MVLAENVGIKEYLGSHEGFNGIIKNMIEDFHVYEISKDGSVVHLNELICKEDVKNDLRNKLNNEKGINIIKNNFEFNEEIKKSLIEKHCFTNLDLSIIKQFICSLAELNDVCFPSVKQVTEDKALENLYMNSCSALQKTEINAEREEEENNQNKKEAEKKLSGEKENVKEVRENVKEVRENEKEIRENEKDVSENEKEVRENEKEVREKKNENDLNSSVCLSSFMNLNIPFPCCFIFGNSIGSENLLSTEDIRRIRTKIHEGIRTCFPCFTSETTIYKFKDKMNTSLLSTLHCKDLPLFNFSSEIKAICLKPKFVCLKYLLTRNLQTKSNISTLRSVSRSNSFKDTESIAGVFGNEYKENTEKMCGKTEEIPECKEMEKKKKVSKIKCYMETGRDGNIDVRTNEESCEQSWEEKEQRKRKLDKTFCKDIVASLSGAAEKKVRKETKNVEVGGRNQDIENDESIISEKKLSSVEAAKEILSDDLFYSEEKTKEKAQVKKRLLPEKCREEEEEGKSVLMWLQEANMSKREEERWCRDRGDYLQFTMYKMNRETSECINIISKCVNRQIKDFSFAGSKDKRGITVQKVTVYKLSKDKLKSALLDRRWDRCIHIGGLKYVQNPLKLGSLRGNKFVTVIKGIDTASKGKVIDAINNVKNNGFINYFGMQRFGSKAISTHFIGAAILRREWRDAVRLILGDETLCSEKYNPKYFLEVDNNVDASHNNNSDFLLKNKNACDEYLLHGNVEEAIRKLPHFLYLEKILLLSLREGKSFCECLRKLPHNCFSLYIHALQSVIFNEVVSYKLEKYKMNVVEGDLVCIDEDANKNNNFNKKTRNKNHIMTNRLRKPKILSSNDNDEINENSDEFYEEEERVISVKAVSKSDIEEKRVNIYDVVIPLPGYEVEYPVYLLDVYENILKKKFNLSLETFEQADNMKGGCIKGAYRKMLTRAEEINYRWINEINDHNKVQVECDLSKLMRRKTSKQEECGIDIYLKEENYNSLQVSEQKENHETKIKAKDSDKPQNDFLLPWGWWLENRKPRICNISDENNYVDITDEENIHNNCINSNNAIIKKNTNNNNNINKSISKINVFGKSACVFECSLAKSSYITMLFREMMKNNKYL